MPAADCADKIYGARRRVSAAVGGLSAVLEPQDHPQESSAVTVTRSGSGASVVLAGQIDLDAAARLRAETEKLLAESGPVVLDWQAAGHASGGAVQVLLALGAALKARGRALAVSRDQAEIRSMLERAGLSSYFPIAEEPT